MLPRLREGILQSIAIKTTILEDNALLSSVEEAINLCYQTIKNECKIHFCGNGGSAADAQHLAGELSGRFYYDRPPINAEALNVNIAYLTAVSNDYGYDQIFERAIRAKGQKGDVLFALSTSGNSPNIVKVTETAQKMGLKVIGMTGEGGGKIAVFSDVLLAVPSTDTPRIQECHMLLGHLICELLEAKLFPKGL